MSLLHWGAYSAIALLGVSALLCLADTEGRPQDRASAYARGIGFLLAAMLLKSFL
jgi:hypothetical protein